MELCKNGKLIWSRARTCWCRCGLNSWRRSRSPCSSAVISSISKSIVGARGKSAFLLKDSSKGKRKRHEMEEVKDEESQLKENKQEYLQQVKRLKQDNEELAAKVQDL